MSSSVDRERVFEAFSSIVDPETNASVINLGLLESLCVNGSSVEVKIHPVSPYAPIVFVIRTAIDIASALENFEGVEKFSVSVEGHPLSPYLNRCLASLFSGEGDYWPPISVRG